MMPDSKDVKASYLSELLKDVCDDVDDMENILLKYPLPSLHSLVPFYMSALSREWSRQCHHHFRRRSDNNSFQGNSEKLLLQFDKDDAPPEVLLHSDAQTMDYQTAARNLANTLQQIFPEEEDSTYALCEFLLQSDHSSSSINNEARVAKMPLARNDRKRLLVIQYTLMYVFCHANADEKEKETDPTLLGFLQGLQKVLIPYMLLPCPEQDADTSDTSLLIAPPSEDLSIALLDVVQVVLEFANIHGKSVDGDEEEEPIGIYWNVILKTLVASQHPNASLLLVRLLQSITREGAGLVKFAERSETVLQAFYDKLWNCIQQAGQEGYGYQNSMSSNSGNDTSMNLMTAGRDCQTEHPKLASLSKNLFLPYMSMMMATDDGGDDKKKGNKASAPPESKLLQEPHRQHVLQLWNRLLQWVEDQDALQVLTWNEQQQKQKESGDSSISLVQQQQQQQTVLLVATTVLCPLLPHLFPAGRSISNTMPKELATPQSMETLWKLIYACLSQGRWSLRDPHSLSGCSTNNHGVASMLRRRALYLLDVLTSSGVAMATNSATTTTMATSPQLWKDYILCFETFEMEGERHIVDQVWPVLAKLIRHAAATLDSEIPFVSGVMTPAWIQLLMGQLVSSEQTTVRKLGMFRMLQVMGRPIADADKEEAKMVVEASIAAAKADAEAAAALAAKKATEVSNTTAEKIQSSKVAKRNKKKMQKQQKLQQKAKKTNPAAGGNKKKGKKSLEDIPTTLMLRMLPAEVFLWDVLVPAFDSLGGSSVGYTVHMDEKEQSLTANSAPKRLHKVDMIPLFTIMIQNYISAADNDESAAAFWKGVWDWSRLLEHLATKTIVLLYLSASRAIQSETATIPMTNTDFDSIHDAFGKLFKDKSVVLAYRKELLGYLSKLLASSRLPTVPSPIPSMNGWSPLGMLSIVSLFLPQYFSLDSVDWSIEQEDTLVTLSKWIEQLQNQKPGQRDFAPTVGATLATAFVSGQMKPPQGETSVQQGTWRPLEGCSAYEQDMGWAVCLFCTLSVEGESSKSAPALLWPAIHKGLSNTGAAVLGASHPNADIVARSLLLLQYGCQLRVLSGLGHGDLVVDPKTQQIMPPPPNVEKMLQSSADFIQWQIRQLLSVDSVADVAGSTRSKETRRLASTYASLITQLTILHQSYPSSETLSSAMNELLKSSYDELSKEQEHPDTCDDVKTIMLMGLMYAALSSFADPGKEQHLPMSRLVTKVALNGKSADAPKAWKQSARSMLQFSKWGSCSCLLPLILKDLDGASDEKRKETEALVEQLLQEGIDSVTMTPSDALRPLFDCIVTTSNQWADAASKHSSLQGEVSYVKTLGKTIKALLVLLEESSISAQTAYFLNEICALIFQPQLMKEEYSRLQKDSTCDTPIRDTFRQLIAMAGTKRAHISRAVLCRVTVGWTGTEESEKGMNAIPYRDDIVQLLVRKEETHDESATNQSKGVLPTEGVLKIPDNTNERSISRTFVLCFLDALPDPGKGLNETVEKELLQYVILQLLECTKTEDGTNPAAVMVGTPTYCVKMRAWQALVILSRFVTDDIANQVCQSVFETMSYPIHSQIRYFMEIFAVQCACKHSDLFGEAFVKDISRTDLSLQHIASLMIMGGNFILNPKCRLDYFTKDADKKRLKRVVASIIPWLSSTQGFSRGIAQMLVYELIPRVLDNGMEFDPANPTDSSDWYLKITYDFLDKNKDMQRLRSKQGKFFEEYDLDNMGLEFIMKIPLDDETDEADAVHAIDAIKECLRSTYEEAHAEDAPVWKQIDEWKAEQALLQEAEEDSDGDDDETDNNATFQRKIIPLDSLNLTLEDLREQRLSNAAGTHKQPLIVCASLVDKIPNLGGLARTSEIFAAQSLVIPDKSVTKMDNFKSLSVGAADWIDIEEVKEDDLLMWLLQKRSQGYWIVGLEQTSSSLPLQDIQMPTDKPTVLLLGKEKEGIPVRFLQAVDQCMEIPQFGMIRSLNVHVSGAIAIWEFTRRTRLEK